MSLNTVGGYSLYAIVLHRNAISTLLSELLVLTRTLCIRSTASAEYTPAPQAGSHHADHDYGEHDHAVHRYHLDDLHDVDGVYDEYAFHLNGLA